MDSDSIPRSFIPVGQPMMHSKAVDIEAAPREHTRYSRKYARNIGNYHAYYVLLIHNVTSLYLCDYIVYRTVWRKHGEHQLVAVHRAVDNEGSIA